MEFARYLPDTRHSVYQWLRTYSYEVGSASGTLLNHFSQLTLQPAYPSDLTRLTGPTLALGDLDLVSSAEDLYGEQAADQIIALSLFGFVLKQGSDQGNSLYLARLMNDVFLLFDRVGRSEGLVLYDQNTKGEIGEIEVTRAVARRLVELQPAVEATRFRFALDAEIALTVEV